MKDNQVPMPACAACDRETKERICFSEEGLGSKGCPTLTHKELLSDAMNEYEISKIKEFARQSSIQEGECYANRNQRPYVMQPTKTRIVEIYEFAKRMGFKRLGLAFCLGLAREASIVGDIFQAHGFEVVSVVCKAGRTLKDRIGVKDEEKVYQGTDEAMCNPIFQAKLFNHKETEFNVLLGLCVGHDSLFFKYAQAPTTVLGVKDRVTGHNPMAPIYLSESYYRKIKKPKF